MKGYLKYNSLQENKAIFKKMKEFSAKFLKNRFLSTSALLVVK